MIHQNRLKNNTYRIIIPEWCYNNNKTWRPQHKRCWKHRTTAHFLKGLSHEIFGPVHWPVWMHLDLNKNYFWFLNFEEAPSSHFKFWCVSVQTFSGILRIFEKDCQLWTQLPILLQELETHLPILLRELGTQCKIYSWEPPFTPPNPANFFFQSK